MPNLLQLLGIDDFYKAKTFVYILRPTSNEISLVGMHELVQKWLEKNEILVDGVLATDDKAFLDALAKDDLLRDKIGWTALARFVKEIREHIEVVQLQKVLLTVW